jgi:hypothetical protein
MRWKGLPTYYGAMWLDNSVKGDRAELRVGGAKPPGGYVLRVPEGMVAEVEGGKPERGEIHFETERLTMGLK